MAVNTGLAGQPLTAGQNWCARSPGEVAANLGVDPGTGLAAGRAPQPSNSLAID